MVRRGVSGVPVGRYVPVIWGSVVRGAAKRPLCNREITGHPQVLEYNIHTHVCICIVLPSLILNISFTRVSGKKKKINRVNVILFSKLLYSGLYEMRIHRLLNKTYGRTYGEGSRGLESIHGHIFGVFLIYTERFTVKLKTTATATLVAVHRLTGKSSGTPLGPIRPCLLWTPSHVLRNSHVTRLITSSFIFPLPLAVPKNILPSRSFSCTCVLAYVP